MKILGIVAEYNPFHKGHLYHLKESKKRLNIDYSICIMSSSFVQRGEPAFLDKWTRAEIAVENGVDLVLELPFFYSAQTAEIFSFGAVSILDSLNCVNYISFGSEHDNIYDLNKIAQVLTEEPPLYTNKLKELLKQGNSYPSSREKALEYYFAKTSSNLTKEIGKIVGKSNNILAIEYLKSLKKLNSKIYPFTIKRLGSDYLDENIGQRFSSATSIRKSIKDHRFDQAKTSLTESTIKILSNKNFYDFNDIENYYNYLIFKLINLKDKKELFTIFDVGEDLGNRILNNYDKSIDMNSLVNLLVNKNFTRSRVQRAIFNFLLDNRVENYKNIFDNHINYIRVLASNKKGFEILNRIKKSSSIPISNKFQNLYKSVENKNIIDLEKKATDLFFLGVKQKKIKINMDYKNSPYISK